MSQPLWKTLLNLAIESEGERLSCQECYNLLDQYAEILDSGVEPSEVMVLVKLHLNHCSNCDELFETMLLMVEEANQNVSPSTP